ncbi:SGNH/GDSL hydrolase family protein [Bacillus sonorensis]|uniref:SGNH/GDSL hydrolase family protein n=1 Tax=Bacillus sonorensis TaxID=119858 RepID=UPI000495BBDF|nr:SGNH/GDSL hydrolase family protein [Bacillus sonorensis]MCY8403777.1 SGNH/GDSL hydrolase family protein [Bacillus sonorensis]MCY8564938.1 SGNH/GDSL hydrolase family protein [Bacillus sonorensis]MEC1355813.1 SGNH/GDSL hydrolase family protein [Bacillus sonorensis]MEC1425783.1 SGNH/GDSL hydrolase family protein [Bacillus sonorensis]MEC1440344.1 SGNH/GDSL hydrolase family protein [Bacillus sonorensis]
MSIRFISVVAALVCLLSACTGGNAGAGKTAAAPKRSIVIAAVGDSLTEGVGDQGGKGYVGMIAEKLKNSSDVTSVKVKNYAVKGYRTDDLLKKLEEKKVQDGLKDADYIFLTIGGNDLMKVVRQHFSHLTLQPFRSEQKAFEQRFAKILTEIRKQNGRADMIYVGMYNPFTFTLSELREVDQVVGEWNQGAERQLKKIPNAKMADIADIFEEYSDEKKMADDDFHPNQFGYALIAKRVYDQMRQEELPTE